MVDELTRLKEATQEAIRILARNTPMVDSGKPGGEIADAMDQARFVLSNALQGEVSPPDTIPIQPGGSAGLFAPARGSLGKSRHESGFPPTQAEE